MMERGKFMEWFSLHLDTNCSWATQKTPGIKRGCRLIAHCQKHNCVSTQDQTVGELVPRTPWIQKLKKKKKQCPWHPEAICCDVPISAHSPGWQDKNTKVGGGCKVARQAQSSIFHTHAWVSDLVKVSERRAAPPWWSSLSLLVDTVDTDWVPVYCRRISMLPAQLWMWRAHTGMTIISRAASSH